MYHILTPYAKPIEQLVWWDGGFTEDELDWLKNEALNAQQQAYTGKNPNNPNRNIRRSQVSWLSKNNDTSWVYERLSEIVSQLNADYFNFDLTGFGEPLQLTNYDQSENGMYGWHQDYNSTVSRKLSVVLQLTDPCEYEGGNLQLFTGIEPVNVRKQRGLIVAFPSYILHQVTPVVRGSRQSLVAWVSGPQFK